MNYINKKHSSPFGTTTPSGPGTPHCRGFTTTLRHTTLGRTPLDEWSARSRDFYLTTHNTHKRQISMLLADWNPQTQHAINMNYSVLTQHFLINSDATCFDPYRSSSGELHKFLKTI